MWPDDSERLIARYLFCDKNTIIIIIIITTKANDHGFTEGKGSSSWLFAKPLKDHGFSLNKGEFRDALCLRYGWQLRNLPQYCICGKGFSTDYAMICTHGGMIIAQHNEIRDLTAGWLNEVCRETETEPQLQPHSREIILPRSANKQDDARVDIKSSYDTTLAWMRCHIFHFNEICNIMH